MKPLILLTRTQPELFLDPNRFGLGSKSDLVSDPNPIWSRTQIRFGLGTKSDLVLEPSRIWSWSQLGFGLGPNSDLVSDPNSDLVLDPNSDLVSDPGLSEPGYSEDGYSEVTWNPVTPNRCSTLVISWHLDFFFDFFLIFFCIYLFLIFATTSITYFTLLNPMAMYIGNGHFCFLLFFSCANIFW